MGLELGHLERHFLMETRIHGKTVFILIPGPWVTFSYAGEAVITGEDKRANCMGYFRLQSMPSSRSHRHRPACSMGATMMIWKCSTYYWAFVRGNHQWLVNSPHKGPICLHPGHSETDLHSEWVRSIVHLMMNVKTWKCRWMHYWPFQRGIHWSSVDSPHKGQVINWDSPHKESVMRSFDVFFVESQNKLLNKQLSCWMIWDAMMLMWHHCNENIHHGDYWDVTGMSLGRHCQWM